MIVKEFLKYKTIIERKNNVKKITSGIYLSKFNENTLKICVFHCL